MGILQYFSHTNQIHSKKLQQINYMVTIAIGDTHGNPLWKKVVEQEKDANEFVFIGDYFDTHDNISAVAQIHNFKEIINFKKANMDKVVLLIGNHDFHYLRGSDLPYSGFQPLHQHDIQEVLEAALAERLMQMCYTDEQRKYLFSHAGVSTIWAKSVLNDLIGYLTIAERINDLFEQNRSAFEFTRGRYWSQTGDDDTQTPIWIRPKSLQQCFIPDYVHVVGHSSQKKMIIGTDIILVDCMNTSEEYLIITDGVPTIGKIEY